MKPQDLRDKCSRAMLESGPDVKVMLTIPEPPDFDPQQQVVELGLRSQGPMGVIKKRSTIDGKKMLDVHVKAADLLKALR